MEFEGEHKVIPIKGISRAGADSLCEDGAMNEVIGLEYKDGSYVPCTNYPSVEGKNAHTGHNVLSSNTTFIYIHKTNTQTNIILIVEGRLAWGDYSVIDDYSYYDKETFKSVVNPLSVHAIGEMLIVSSKTGLSYWLFNGTTKTYDLYQDEDIENNLPKVSLQVSYIDNEHPMKGKYNDGQLLCARSTNPSQSTSNIILINGQTIGTTYNVNLDSEDAYSYIADTAVKARNMVREKGRLADYHLAVVAYRLKTGEYVYASAPLLLGKPRNENNNPINGEDNIFYAPDDEKYSTGRFLAPLHFGMGDKYWDAFECTISKGTLRQASGGYSLLGDNRRTIGALYPLPALFGYYRSGSPYGAGETVENCFVVCAYGNVLKYHIDKTIDEKYRNLIDCCCIFLSEPISPYKEFSSENVIATEKAGFRQNGTESYYTMGYGFVLKEEDEILSDIKDTQNFYKVKEIPFSDIVKTKTDTYIYVDLEGKLGDNLLLQETLPLYAFDHSRVISADMTSYNSRLHLTNYKKKMFSGFKLSDFVLTGGIGQYAQASYSNAAISATLYIRTLIKSIDGDSEVWSKESLANRSSLAENIFVNNRYNPIISYPDANAYKMEIYIEIKYLSSSIPDSGATEGGITDDTTIQVVSSEDTVAPTTTITTLLKCCTIDLAPSRNGGFAYGIFATAMYTPSGATEGEKRLLSFFDFEANSEKVEKLSGNPTEGVNTSILCRNQIKISDTNIPNYFPNTGIVTVGDGEIIGLAKLSIALSQDTFGRYPLLAFCSDGIYSMQTSDTGSYSSVAPFSREVCINKKTICEIDGAVLFASSKGLMVATSSGVEEFSPTLNGKPRHLPNEDRYKNGLGLELYNKIINSTYSTQLSKFIEGVDFRDYLSLHNTVVTYASEKNKIIVYNKDKKYIYWIDIPTRNTTQLPIQIRLDDNNYPTENYFLYTDNSASAQNIISTSFVQDLTAIDGASDFGIQTLLQSRPIKLSSELKESIRIVLRGRFKSVLEDKYGVLLVLCSMDGVNWQPIGYSEREISNGGIHDIGCVTDRVSCKYLMYIFTATLSVDSHIDSIEMSVYDKYKNKLR